jgi:F1F0 ATPase subunit 2
MSEPISLLLAAIAGCLLGTVFFGGLWWTVRKGVSASQPAFLFLGSMLLRTGIVLVGFYFVASQHMDRLVVCLLGFVAARIVIMQMTRPTQEAHHAP